MQKKSGWNEKQKKEILKYVESEFFGQVILTPDSTEEILKVFDEDWSFNDEDIQQEVRRRVLKEGKIVYRGCVCDEGWGYNYAETFERIWEIMKENGEDDFVEIDGDLSY